MTRQYNEALKKRLPDYGVQVIEISRIKVENVIISATSVRKLLIECKWEKIERFVPVSTLTI